MNLVISDVKESYYEAKDSLLLDTQDDSDYIKCAELYVLFSSFDYLFTCVICKNHAKYNTINDLIAHVKVEHNDDQSQSPQPFFPKGSVFEDIQDEDSNFSSSSEDDQENNCDFGNHETASENNQNSNHALHQLERISQSVDLLTSDEENKNDVHTQCSNQQSLADSDKCILKSDSPFNRQCVIELIDGYRKCIGLWHRKTKRDTRHRIKTKAFSYLYERFSAHYPSCRQHDLHDLLISMKKRFQAKNSEHIQEADNKSEDWYLSHLHFFLHANDEELSDKDFQDFNCPSCEYEACGSIRYGDLWNHIVTDHLRAKPKKEKQDDPKKKKNMPLQWPNEQLQKFIEILQKHECIWNTKCKEFYHRSTKSKAYTDLIEEFDQLYRNVLENEETVDQIIRRLRNHYYLQDKKYKSMHANGKKIATRFLERFKIYENLSFLTEAVLRVRRSAIVDYTCELCDLMCNSQRRLTAHSANEHPDAIYECGRCPRSFRSQLKTKRHRISHGKSDEEPYTCSVCNEFCTNSDGLKAHLKIHLPSEPRKHMCEYCGAKFSDSGNLLSHINRHTSTKKHVCTICNKGFVTSTEFKSHSALHNDSHLFVCKVCGLKFNRRTALSKHKYIHGEPKFSCSHCEEKFRTPQQLSTHQKKEGHGAKKFYCTVCFTAYNCFTTMRKHMRKRHNDKFRPRSLAL